jgi:hypothetical protein
LKVAWKEQEQECAAAGPWARGDGTPLGKSP